MATERLIDHEAYASGGEPAGEFGEIWLCPISETARPLGDLANERISSQPGIMESAESNGMDIVAVTASHGKIMRIG